MRAFAELLERLAFTPSRHAKLRLLTRHFAEQGDPARGWALAAMTGLLAFPSVKAGVIRALASEHSDPELFALSHDFVGDLAETVALIWRADEADDPPALETVITSLQSVKRDRAGALLAGYLDRCRAPERLALLKLITGGLRVGVSGGLARQALAEYGERPVAEIEETWHGLAPPFTELFAWLEGRAPRPDPGSRPVFRPLMLANPLEPADRARLDPKDYLAEWKWDGIRVQLVATDTERRLYSRSGDDISAAFPEIIEAMGFSGVLDGELLVLEDGAVQPFNRLQQRLGRKRVTARMRAAHPAHVRLYDCLRLAGEDLRPLPFAERRARLDGWWQHHRPARTDLSPLVALDGWDDLDRLRAATRGGVIEGLMLKRRDAPYLAGRPKGLWWKVKRDPLTIDAVLIYAQRGHGKRSSFYSDYTFGCWRDGALLPVGKAYSGFTDAELRQLDRFVRQNSIDRFGPVRQVAPSLVLEIAFDSVHPSSRHKSGVALRFPRIHRIRWDKPAGEADRVSALEALMPAPQAG